MTLQVFGGDFYDFAVFVGDDEVAVGAFLFVNKTLASLLDAFFNQSIKVFP